MKIKSICLLLLVIILTGCDSSNNNFTIEGIKFSKEEIAQIDQRRIPRDYIEGIIQGARKNGTNDTEIKNIILSIRSYGFDPVEYLGEVVQNDKNLLYETCYNEYSKSIKTLNDKEYLVKFCDCYADCILHNIKAINNLPKSLSEKDEKDKAKVDLAWIKLEKQCSTMCKKQN